MIQDIATEGDRGKLRAHPTDRADRATPRAARASRPSGDHPLRGFWSRLADKLFEAPTDALGRINFWCSMIALACVGGIIALWIVSEIVR